MTCVRSVIKYIKDCPFDVLIEGVKKKQLLTKLIKGLNTYFAPVMLNLLTSDDVIEFQKHEKGKAFFYYQNGFVQVTKKGTEFKEYKFLKKKIWSTSILKRDYHEKVNYKDFAYYKFCNTVAGNKDGKKLNRFNSLKSLLGYLLHDYFDTNLKAACLTDSRVSVGDEARGGSGKGLLVKGVGFMIDADMKKPTTYCNIDGKKLETTQFAMQLVGKETILVCFDDLKKGFNVEFFYNDILEGLTVEKKGQQQFKQQVKMVFTVNKLLKLSGESSERRFYEYELADHYNAKHTPSHEFGKWFFSAWNDSEWAKFDSFMLECIRFYLEKGLLDAEPINLYERKLRELTNGVFVDWMDFYFDQEVPDGELKGKTKIINPIFGQPHIKKDLYDTYVYKYPDFKKMKQGTFTKWMKLYGKYRIKIGETKEYRSSSGDKIQFFRTQDEKTLYEKEGKELKEFFDKTDKK